MDSENLEMSQISLELEFINPAKDFVTHQERKKKLEKKDLSKVEEEKLAKSQLVAKPLLIP
jgi:hypothetical protein